MYIGSAFPALRIVLPLGWAKVSDRALLGGGQETLPNTAFSFFMVPCRGMAIAQKMGGESYFQYIIFQAPCQLELFTPFQRLVIEFGKHLLPILKRRPLS
jgi:hypothetical protein